MAKLRKLTKKQYVEYFNFHIRFTRALREYLQERVLEEGEILDSRPITHCFIKSGKNNQSYIQIKYFLLLGEYDEEDMGDRIVEVPLEQFEREMNWN